ncbi:hypothetical protein Hypma_016191 [Hypsizygus marmoreus]|uniref:Uncharacterized protein n=1 Tax=Hypsizygus marmoreus TaxID=39966 RepID=A0A369J0P2_HYPMA|nr:hypothetical protein Hypma_016191 [Hypsizygus marmoreus]
MDDRGTECQIAGFEYSTGIPASMIDRDVPASFKLNRRRLRNILTLLRQTFGTPLCDRNPESYWYGAR